MIDILGEDKQFIEIVKTGKEEKPYYNIKYLDRVTGKTHIGYSSYNLEIISQFLRENFIEQARWISVSERLPEEYADVICCTNKEEVFIATYLGKMNDGVDCFDDDNGMMWEGDVMAWMPLPEWEE